MSPREGLLLVDKPVGPTSHDLVARARRLLGQPRIGHAGTLDPPASGLLVLLLGRATRLARYLDDEPKTYVGSLVLGTTTSTDDAAGEVLHRHSGPLPSEDRVHTCARELLGALDQVPPAVSARKVGGQRLYRLARRGVAVEAPPARVIVSAFDLQPGPSPEAWTFRAVVSAGTYVRSLARDLGRLLGCGAALTSLRRTASGALRLDDALPSTGDDAVDGAAWGRALVPVENAPLRPPPVRLAAPGDEARFLAGAPAGLPAGGPLVGEVRVLAASGRLLGIGEAGSGEVRPRVVLADP